MLEEKFSITEHPAETAGFVTVENTIAVGLVGPSTLVQV
jgi:hypothetical protein